MRTWLVSLAAVAALSLAAVPSALADPYPPGITANGSGQVTVDADANADAIRAAYRQALGVAVDDAKGTAGFLAGKAGLGVGAITSVYEQSTAPVDGCATAIAYAKGLPEKAAGNRRAVRKRKAKRNRRRRPGTARPAQTSSPPSSGDGSEPGPRPVKCPIQASVSVTFAIAPPAP